MRSMHIALKHFLYKINAVDLDKCPCGEGSQTPKHVLLQCQTFGELRRVLWRVLWDRLNGPAIGLSKNGKQNLTDYDTIVSHPLATRYRC